MRVIDAFNHILPTRYYQELSRVLPDQNMALKGRKVSPGTRLFIVPGTTDLARRLVAENLFEIYQEAGAIVLPAGCGPCAGGNTGPLAPGEVSICTAATNSTGRFGATDARIYLGSPATVAASAVNGRITDPRTFSDLAPSS